MQKGDINVRAVSGPLGDIEADVIVVTSGPRGFQGPASQLNDALGGLLQSLVSEGVFMGHTFEAERVFPAPGLSTKRVLLLGSGKSDQYDVRVFRHVAGAAVRMARRHGARRVCLALTPPQGFDAAKTAEVATDGALTALSDSDLYKDHVEKPQVAEVLIWAARDQQSTARGIERGRAIAEAVNFARWLGDEPSNVMTTLRLGEEAAKMAAEHGIECELLEEPELRDLGMNSLLSVSAGSQYPPRVAVLTYKGGGTGPTIGLVGKGVVFDTGGISIKPAADMHYMKYDMCGAANVIATVQALASLKAPVNVIAVAGLVENMPGGRATRPGDVVRAANGKTIEVINTDAEGRLVLADALHLAIQRGADRLVDVATLTGAIKIALGEAATGVMGKPQPWVDALLRASERAGERAWQMPIYPEYRDKLKSNIADLMNTGGRAGGAVNAAAFLQEFTGDKPWVHLDIAGTGWTEKDSAWQSKGATGAMIRSMIALAEDSAVDHEATTS